MAIEARALQFLKRTTDPATNPPPGEVFFYVLGNSFKYKNESGAVSTLSTGVTAEEVEDFVGNLFTDSSSIEPVYDDANNLLKVQLKASVVQKIEGSVAAHSDIDLTGISEGDMLRWDSADDKFVRMPPLTMVFGTEAEDFVVTGQISYTTNTAFKAYATTVSSKPPGRYRISGNLLLKPGSTGSDDVISLRVNGTVIGLPIAYEDEGKDTGSNISRPIPLLGYYQHLSAGPFDVEIWANQTGSGTSILKGLVGELWRVSI